MTRDPGANGQPIASSRATRDVLHAGTLASAACFVAALLLEALGRPHGAGDPSDLRAVLTSTLALESWGWATIGTLAIIVTPAAGLVATALEYRAVADRRTTLTALLVLAILAVSLGVALSG